MVDINISYEDGLRLSELLGQHDGLEYQIANYEQMIVPDCLFAAIAIGFGAFALGLFILMLLDHEFTNVGYWATIITGLVIFPIAVGVSSFFIMEFIDMNYTILNVEQDLANVEGQINALLAKYGMVWDDLLNTISPM